MQDASIIQNWQRRRGPCRQLFPINIYMYDAWLLLSVGWCPKLHGSEQQ